MPQWLNRPTGGNSGPVDWFRYNDPIPPPGATNYSTLLTDANNDTGAGTQAFDRSETMQLLLGSLPPEMVAMTAYRPHGMIALCFTLGGTGHTLYAVIKRSDGGVITELSIPLTQTETPVAFDFGWVPVSGDSPVWAEFSCGTNEGAVNNTFIMAELFYDYEGTIATPREPGVEIDSEPNGITIHSPGATAIDTSPNQVTIHSRGAIAIATDGPNEIIIH